MPPQPEFSPGHQEIVTELLAAGGQDVNNRGSTGKTALTAAVQNGEQLVAALLLHVYISGQIGIFKELVEKEGVDIQMTNGEGKTAEQLAR